MIPAALLLIGPLPEPRGGVSTHIDRLGRLVGDLFAVVHVDESRCRKPGIFNLRSLNLFRYLALVRKTDIVHIHSGRPSLRAFHVLVARLLGKRTVVTIHSRASKNRAGALLDRLFLRWAHKVIVVEKVIGENLRLKRPLLIHHGFIPPSLEIEPALPAEVKYWLEEQLGRKRKIIVANAWRLDRYRGADLYGLDICIELARRLKENKSAVAFLFAVSSLERHRERFNMFKESIRGNGLQDSFLLYHGLLSFSRLIEKAHCVLRPTRADGDSLTVREALFFGKPVIASDAAARPKDAALFKSGDIEDLLANVLAVMEPGVAATENTAETGSPLAFYRGLYARAEG